MLFCNFCEATGLSGDEALRLFNYPDREEYMERLRKKVGRVYRDDWDITMEEVREAIEAEWLLRCLRELGIFREALETGDLVWSNRPERSEVEARINRAKGEKFGMGEEVVRD